MKKLFFNIVGCLLTIIGLISIISYLNMLDVGYSFKEYLQFITHHMECLSACVGIMILVCNN